MNLIPFIEYIEKGHKGKIGILKNNLKCLSGYKKGEAVLFKPNNNDHTLCDAPLSTIEYNNTHCTIEVPFEKMGYPFTMRTTVGVPIIEVDEVKLNPSNN